MKAHWQMFAAYNEWANARLYAAAASLSDIDYRADRGAFFKSLHGTHLLATDRIWMQRFTGQGEAPSRLDAILYESLPDLREARFEEDARIIAWIESLDEAGLSGTFRYLRISSDEEFEQALAPALAHWFNHQTHHRGQAHAILTSFSSATPELDLLYFQREAGLGGTRRIG